MRQLPSLPADQYSRPIPPCVWISPFSTVMLPGPTCFQPLRSLPLNSCCQGFSGCEYPGSASTPTADKSKKNKLRIHSPSPANILQDSSRRVKILECGSVPACRRLLLLRCNVQRKDK